MRCFGVVGRSGMGKTTLVEALIPEMRRRGLSVSTVKHTHHAVDLDQPGKDSFRHRVAGASEVLLASPARWTLLHEVDSTEPEPELQSLLNHMTPVDLVLVESFRAQPFGKLEVFRASVGKTPLYPDDPTILAVAGDDAPDSASSIPRFPLEDVVAIATFILTQLGMLR